MSALTDLFTALANKIRSKTGTATTYTPAQMVSDGIDDVYDAGYAAGGGGATGTPITPSNSSPASMTSGTTYEAQANGYAIASYSSVTPSDSSPASLSSGSIYKMGGAGKAVENVRSVYPDGSNPTSAALLADKIYQPTRSGYAINTYTGFSVTGSGVSTLYANSMYLPSNNCYAIASNPTSLTPNNTSPPSIASDTFYKGAGTGKAIESIATNGNGVTPSASGQYFYSGWNRMTASGYAYTSAQKRTASGTVALSTSTSTKVTTGFRPKYIMAYSSSTASQGFCYNADISTTQFRFFNSSGNGNASLGSSTGNYLYSINDDGFTINKASSARTYYWFASE